MRWTQAEFALVGTIPGANGNLDKSEFKAMRKTRATKVTPFSLLFVMSFPLSVNEPKRNIV